MAGINVTTKELTSLAFKEDATVEEATKVLDSLSQKINNLKAKVRIVTVTDNMSISVFFFVVFVVYSGTPFHTKCVSLYAKFTH